MSENIRPALYGAVYSAFLANRTSTAKLISSRVVGKHCETGDILISEINLPSDIKAGDLLAYLQLVHMDAAWLVTTTTFQGLQLLQ